MPNNKNKKTSSSNLAQDMWQNFMNNPIPNPSSPTGSSSAQSSFRSPSQPLGFAQYAPIANPFPLAPDDPRNHYAHQGWYQTQHPQTSHYQTTYSQYPQNPHPQNPPYYGNPYQQTNFSVPDDEVEVEEGEDEVEVETQEDTKQKRKQVRWSDEEARILAERWVHCSENGVQGNSQTDASFWKKVQKDYNSLVAEKRNVNQLSGKWNKIAPDVKKFNAIYKNYFELHPQSGARDEDVLEASRKHFKQQNNKRKFIYEQCWNVLKHYPKFFAEPGVMSNKRTFEPDPEPVNLEADDSQPVASSLAANMQRLFQNDPIRRPPGRKAQKSSGSSDAATSSRSLRDEKLEALEEVKKTARLQQTAINTITENSTKS